MDDKQKNKKIIDIVRPQKKYKEPAAEPIVEKKMPEIKKEPEEKEIAKKVEEAKILDEFDRKVETFEKKEIEKFKKEEEITEFKKRRFRIKFKTAALLAIVLVLVGGLIYSALAFLPRADIKITAKKTNWEYMDSVTVSKSVAAVDANNKQIPGEIFTQRKNLTLSFSATGKQYVEKKSKGKLVVYNAFSSESQTLIAGTRFAVPDGKILKLDAKMVVPGAKISEGKIVPSSVEGMVTAEKAGDQYNIGPISKLTLPGFKGSAKYDGFYGALNEQLTGGFVGEIAVATDADIKQGRDKTTQTLKENLDVFINSQIPPEFKIIDGAKQFSVVKENINKEADAGGNFMVYIEAETSIIGFGETNLLQMLNDLGGNSLGEGFETKTFQMDYGVARADFKNGKMSFPVDFKGVFWQPIDGDKIKASITDKTEKELKTAVFALPGVEKATVSLWPFWVKRVPDNFNRIKVEVD